MDIENRAAQKIVGVYFVALSVLMYYFLNDDLYFGLSITYRHLFAIIIIFSGFVYFLIKPDIARASVALKSSLVLGLPLLVIFTSSLMVWFVEQSELHVITRGLSYNFIYMNFFHAALTAAVLLYVFGEKGLWYNLAAILVANLLMICTIIAQNGVAAFFSELATLIMTFADETGSVIMKAEIHELAFCLGAYLIYMLLYPRKSIFALLLFCLATFCFVCAFKRIAMIGMLGALVFAYIMKLLKARGKEKLVMRIITVTMLLMILLLLAYVGVVKWGIFQKLEDIGINTSGRDNIYRAVDKFYEFSPTFIGNGMGFLTFKLNSGLDINVSAIHNEFLNYFIDIGFWGFIFWLLAFTVVRTKYFGREGFTEGAIVASAIVLYIIIVSATDNTLNYHLFNTVADMIIMGHGFDKRVEKENKRIFGSSS